ncbi:hypothetical protein FKM82_020490 [Ascaphus truei]
MTFIILRLYLKTNIRKDTIWRYYCEKKTTHHVFSSKSGRSCGHWILCTFTDMSISYILIVIHWGTLLPLSIMYVLSYYTGSPQFCGRLFFIESHLCTSLYIY